MSNDPTGAARTALEEMIARDHLTSISASGDFLVTDGTRARTAKGIADAVLSHLAGQAGPEVRGLVEAFDKAVSDYVAAMETSDSWSVEERVADAARTALLAAYEALRQQRDEAEQATLRAICEAYGGTWHDKDWHTPAGVASIIESLSGQARLKAVECFAALREAASERQRADRLQAAVSVLRAANAELSREIDEAFQKRGEDDAD